MRANEGYNFMSYSFNAVEMDQRSPLPLNLLLDRSGWMFSPLGKSLGMRRAAVEAKLARRCASHGDPSTYAYSYWAAGRYRFL